MCMIRVKLICKYHRFITIKQHEFTKLKNYITGKNCKLNVFKITNIFSFNDHKIVLIKCADIAKKSDKTCKKYIKYFLQKF